MKQMSGLTDMCGEIFQKDTSIGNAGIGCGKMAAVRPDTGTGVGTYYSGPCES